MKRRKSAEYENERVVPTQGLSQSRRCHSRQSYMAATSACCCVALQLHEVRRSVPSMSSTARRQMDGRPAQPFVTVSTAHAWT